MGPVLGPHACTDRTRDTRGPEAWLPAPEDGRPGEGQRLTPDAPHNGGRPPLLGTAPVAILGSLGVCIYVPASRHWLISYSPIHLI